MKAKKLVVGLMAVFTIGTTLMLTGCDSDKNDRKSKDNTEASVILENMIVDDDVHGVVTLSVNPEIEIQYDKDGKVIALVAGNDDGQDIIDSFTDYTGKKCEVVVEGLIREIHDAGYFVEEVEGEGKTIVLELEKGSELPADDFMDDLGESARGTAGELNIKSDVVVRDDDWDDDDRDDNDDDRDDNDDDRDDNDDDRDDNDDDRDDNDDDRDDNYDDIDDTDDADDDLDDVDDYDDVYDDDYDDVYDDDYDDVYDDDYDDVYDDDYDDDWDDDYDDDWDDDYDDDWDDDDWDDDGDDD